jgi:hypothetical protein
MTKKKMPPMDNRMMMMKIMMKRMALMKARTISLPNVHVNEHARNKAISLGD